LSIFDFFLFALQSGLEWDLDEEEEED